MMMEPQQICSVTEADFLENEEFDFDLPVSPVLTHTPIQVVDGKVSTEEQDEDEVFFGPVGFKEQCVAKKTELDSNSPESCKPMSPLTTEQYVEIFKEATKVAMLLKEHSRDKEDSTENGSSKRDEPVNQLTVSISELALRPKQDTSITPDKSEMEQFKRAVKKDMRSPRRTTYTICVSPAGQTPPPHLPTAKECVSSLVKDKPAEIKFTAKKGQEENRKKHVGATKKSKLPAKRSGIPKTSGLRKPKPILQSMGTTKLSPPKRSRLASGESIEGLCVPGSHVPSDTNENNLTCSGKRRTPGSNNPVQNGLCKPAAVGQESASNNVAKNNGTIKLRGSKHSLMKPGVIPRKTLAASRPSKLAKSATAAGTSKLQPMKAMLVLNPKKNTVKAATPRMQIPCTPVTEDKNVVPKRILSSGSLSAIKHTPIPRTTRAFSVDSAIKTKDPHPKTPVRRKPSLPGTPQKSAQKVGSSVTGSSRRRSGIPTPMKRSVSSTSRLSSTSSLKSHQSPRIPVHSPTACMPSPTETPPAPKISPALPTERARQDNTGASPELSSVPMHKKQVIDREALAEIHHRNIPSPQIDLLIKLDTPSPMQKGVKIGSFLDDAVGLSKKCLTPVSVNSTAKENLLIDLL